MARPSAFSDFLRDPDQTARREELRAFVGPNAEPFLKAYDGMRSATLREPGQKRTFGLKSGFVLLAFLLGPCWFLYRKLWLWAGAIVFMMICFSFVPRTFSTGIAVGLAVVGRIAYLQHAISRIVALRGGAPAADLELLRKAGGVSPLAGWISGGLIGLLVLASIAATVLHSSPG